MNCRKEKTVTVVINRSVRNEVAVLPETCVADVRAKLGLAATCVFSLTRAGDGLPADTPVFRMVRHRGRLYAWNDRRLKQMAFDFGAAESGQGRAIGLETSRPPAKGRIS